MDVKPRINPADVTPPQLQKSKSNNRSANASDALATPKVNPGNVVEGVGVNLSQGVQERQKSYDKALQVAKQTSPVREDRISKLKAAIKNGTYQTDSGQIADGMLREAIKEHMATQTQNYDSILAGNGS